MKYQEIIARAMDQMEQRCHDLDAKVRRVEEERDAVMMENDELHDKIAVISQIRNNMAMEESRTDEELREDLTRLSDEVLRLETSVTTLQDSLLQMGDKVKEVGTLKDTVMNIIEDTSSVKEDFLNLKNHLNIAAKIELQTNEKMYENRLHHLEKMLEEMRHREESFLHIAEETNILKDQVDSLRELSLSTMKSDGSSSCHARPMTLDYQGAGSAGAHAQTAMAELQQFALHQELEESPVISEVVTPSSPPVVKFHEVSHQTTASSNNVIKVTGQVKLTVTDQPRGAPAGAATTLANGVTTVTAAVTPSSLSAAQPAASTAEVFEKPVTIFAPEVAPVAEKQPNKSPLKRSREKVLDEDGYSRKADQFTCMDCVTDGFARIWSTWFD